MRLTDDPQSPIEPEVLKTGRKVRKTKRVNTNVVDTEIVTGSRLTGAKRKKIITKARRFTWMRKRGINNNVDLFFYPLEKVWSYTMDFYAPIPLLLIGAIFYSGRWAWILILFIIVRRIIHESG